METLLQIDQSVELINDQLDPQDARDIGRSLLGASVQFQRQKSLKAFENKHYCDEQRKCEDTVNQLEQEKTQLNELITEAVVMGKKVRIKAVVEVAIID